MYHIPRKLIKWFDRLDLTYSIRNLTRDLANGFVVAEILSRYYKEIQMYQYYNDSSMAKRRDNWERIVKFLDSNGKTFTRVDYEPVMHLAKGAALSFIKELYFFLEKDEIVDTRKDRKKKTPYHLKPTATLLMKNRELNRIVDNKKRFTEKVETLKYHYAKSRAEKQHLNLEEFISKQKQRMLEENAKRLFTSKNKNKAIEPQQKEPVEVILKNIEGNKKKNKENTATLDSNMLIEALNNITQNLLDRDENKKFEEMIPTLEKNDIIFIHIMQQTYKYPPELIEKLLNSMVRNINDIKDGLINSFNDFKTFITLMLQFLENLECNTILYELFKKFITKIGEALVAEQPDVTTLYIESIGLEYITEMAKNVSNKRDLLAHIIVSFTENTAPARFRILDKLAQFFKADLRNLSALLAYLSTYVIDDEINPSIFDFYWYKAMKIIEYSYPTMKANGLKILNEISKFNISKMYLALPSLEILSNESWWEIKAQILIICANQLEYVESRLENEGELGVQLEDHVVEAAQGEGGGLDVNDSGIGGGANSEAKNSLNQSRNSSKAGSNNEMKGVRIMNSSSMGGTQDSKELDMSEFIKVKKGYVQSLIEIINKIFHVNQNVNVQKVGLIYLAKILNYFPELCERYLAVLMQINEQVKMSILNTDQAYNIQSHIVLSTNSFKYFQTGASLIWNSSGLAMALNKYVKSENLDAFEFKHIEILAGCLVREIDPKEKERWLEIYGDLQRYIFVSLAAPRQCKIASHIIKKVFLNKDLSESVMETSKDLFLRILELVYQPDIEEECKSNILELFEFLVKESDVYKEYVYQIIKRFSERSHSRYLRTNIVNFMNELARERRVKMFGDNTLESLSF